VQDNCIELTAVETVRPSPGPDMSISQYRMAAVVLQLLEQPCIDLEIETILRFLMSPCLTPYVPKIV
jgi:hypothetical protein